MLGSLLDRLVDPRTLAEPDALLEIFAAFRAGEPAAAAWTTRGNPPWLYVEPPGTELPEQGWKLHLSATTTSAPQVLAACLPWLFAERAAFKFVSSLRLLGLLNSAHAPRSSSGKFITVYPRDLESFRRLAPACHEATAGLAGPKILSDRAFLPGNGADSLAYYRYGAFRSMMTYDPLDGTVIYSIRGPAGELEADVRGVATRQPEWSRDPLGDETPAAAAPPKSPTAVLLRDRYRLTHALRHANKGGVYLGIDAATGAKVILKEARPHVATDRYNRDATARLEREAANLRTLGSLAPAPVDLFWQSGHLFLVLPWLAGKTIYNTVRSQIELRQAPFALPRLLHLSRQLAHLLARAHRRGLVLRDFSPNNVILSPTGRLYLIDGEMACRPGAKRPLGIGEGTPGYASPQQLRRAAPTFADDAFSLAAQLFSLATLHDPVFPADDPPGRRFEDKVRDYLERYTREAGLPEALFPPILAGLASAPEGRWPPAEVFRYLSSLDAHALARQRPRRPVPSIEGSVESARAQARQTAAAAAAHLAASFDFDVKGRPIPPSCNGESTLACNVQHGTSGIGMALLAAARATGDRAHDEVLRRLCAWTVRFLERSPDAPPGLYFGSAGSAWFLLEAARHLADAEIEAVARGLALALPAEPPVSDLTHGAAGIGLTWLHFFHRTGERSFLERAAEMAAYLEATFAGQVEGRRLWSRTRPAAPGGALQPKEILYGFAHGIAGIGQFFLDLGLALPESRFLAMAGECAATLEDAAVAQGGAMYWPQGPARPTLWPHWCNGSSGVGTFLIRWSSATRDHRAARLAALGARAVLRERWTSGVGQCHGLAGNGEFLLDLHQATGDRQFLDGAVHLAEILELQKSIRPTGAVFPEDFTAGLDYSGGTAGVVVFLSRLAADLPRALMLDDLPAAPQAGGVTTGARA